MCEPSLPAGDIGAGGNPISMRRNYERNSLHLSGSLRDAVIACDCGAVISAVLSREALVDKTRPRKEIWTEGKTHFVSGF